MKKGDALKGVFDGVLVAGEPVVFTCGAAITACIDALAYAEAFKAPFSVYDGSFAEYKARA